MSGTITKIEQLGAEVLRQGVPAARVAQLGAEVLRQGGAPLRVAQFGVEVIRSVASPGGALPRRFFVAS